jgi:hypothetical protein
MLIGALIKKITYKVERGPGGEFVGRPIVPELGIQEAATREEVDLKIDERLSRILGMPLATFRLSDIKRIQDPKLKIKIQAATRGALSEMPPAIDQPYSEQQADGASAPATERGFTAEADQSFNASMAHAKNSVEQRPPAKKTSNQFAWRQLEPPPIAPEQSGGTFLKIVIMAIVVLALVYYFLHR